MTKKHYIAIQWCFANKIYVSPLPKKSGIYIEIKEKNKRIISPQHYSQKKLQNKIWELYLYLYQKYNHG
tara:strand:- start:595 stop:801 length:207 start_codon:yes stop_codon:yes gene_type:complete